MLVGARKRVWGLRDRHWSLKMRVGLENAGRGSKMQVWVQRCELGFGNTHGGSKMRSGA
jgi:hypothetical protein